MFFCLKYSTSVGWNESKNDYIPFIENFIATVKNCYNELNTRNLSVKDKSKNKQIEDVIFNSIVPMSKKEISEILVDVSVQTIELVLANLLKAGKIIKIGTTKSAKYIKSRVKGIKNE